jgi:hypothetical protein
VLRKPHSNQPPRHVLAAALRLRRVLGPVAQTSGSRRVELHTLGWLPTEERIAAKRVPSGSSSGGGAPALPAGFKKQPRLPKVQHSTRMGLPAVALPNAPGRGARGGRGRTRCAARRAGGAAAGATHNAVVIDITTGKHLTEVYLSKTALREDPAFLGIHLPDGPNREGACPSRNASHVPWWTCC